MISSESDATSTRVRASSPATRRSAHSENIDFARSIASECEVVPPAHLVPPDLPIRGGSRSDAALLIDGELVRVAGMHAYCRFVRASLARRLVATRAWRNLGFVRISDYSRERLGCSPRTLEEDARVMRLLESLPRCRAALERGTVTWTAVRTIATAANPRNEAWLLAKAQKLGSRELDAFVRRLHERSRDGTIARAGEAEDIDGECPAACDNGTVMAAMTNAGFTSTPASTVLADDDPDDTIRWAIAISRSGRRLWRSAVELASRHAGAPLAKADVLELVVAEAMAALPPATERGWSPTPERLVQRFSEAQKKQQRDEAKLLQDFLAEFGVTEGFDCLSPKLCGPGPAAGLAALLDDIDLLEARQLDERLCTLRIVEQRIDAQMAALLRTLVDRRLFRLLGFPTVRLYVESRLGFSSRRAWSLLAVERASWRVGSEFRDAWKRGTISHLAATLLLPVLNEKNAAAWVERASCVTLRRLSTEVGWSIEHSDAGYHDEWRPGFPHPRNMLPPPVDAEIAAAPSPASFEEVQMRARGEGASAPATRGSLRRLTFDLPLSLAVLVETAIRLHRRSAEAGPSTFERIVALAILEWSALARHRDPVFERDGWRCAVPCCSSRRNLHDHHLLYRSQGGGNARDNRITVCAAHHLHGIHAGIIRAHGRAPSEIVWQMPWARLLGDRYLET